jgi:integrase
VSRLLRYVQGWVDRRTGRPRYRFRRRGFPKVKLPGVPGSTEFMAAYQMAMATAAAPIGIKRNAPGSVAYVVAAYLDSQSHFGRLAPGTRAIRRAILERFREAHGELPFATMPPKFIVWLLDQKRPHVARNWLKALRALSRFAVALDFRKDDPARDIKLAPIKGDGFHTWTDEELAQYEARHAIGSKARLALALGRYTMQRRGDVIRMGRQHIRNGELYVTQQKTGVALILPVHPELQCHARHASQLSRHQERQAIQREGFQQGLPGMVQRGRLAEALQVSWFAQGRSDMGSRSGLEHS